MGFEPTRPKPADLKSAPLDLSGIKAVRRQEAIPRQTNLTYFESFDMSWAFSNGVYIIL